MPRAPRLVTYQGEAMPIMEFADRHGVAQRTAAKWLARDCFTDEHVDAYFAKRDQQAEARALARKHGVAASTLHMRLERGLSLYDAATTPVRVYERRAG